MRTIIRIGAGLLGCWLATATAHESQALYLGNEGVLVSHGKDKVVFDAFFSDSHGLYVLVPDELRTGLTEGRPPFDGIDAVFVSHVHGDHFSPEPTLAYLRAQRKVRLFAPRQVADALAAAAGADDPVLARVTAFDLKPGDPPQTANAGKIRIDVVAIPHSGGARNADIENLAFRATLGKWPTVLHLGDAAPDYARFTELKPLWEAKATDLVFPPVWFYGRDVGRLILMLIGASEAIGIHVAVEAVGNGEFWRREANADLFTDPGESRTIGGHPD